jgi:type II secretory pathway component PulL
MKGIDMFKIPSRLAAASVTVVILVATSGQSQAAGTPEQRRACRADAMKLCRNYIPNVKRITACMERNLSKLSPLCRTQFK